MYARVRPSTAARPTTSAIACRDARGSGPHVPALRYARSRSTGNSVRKEVASTVRAQYPGPCAGSAPKCNKSVTGVHQSSRGPATPADARVASPHMKVTLPDGTPLELPDGATGADAAAAIGPGLARAALAVKQRGEVRDLAQPLIDGQPLEVITAKSGRDALDLIRHDTAHVLAAAVMELYPGVKISIGPPIESGFYYDFDFPPGVTLTEADFPAIEAKMAEHVKAAETFDRVDVGPQEALERFRGEGQDYKVELIEDLVAGEGVESV